MNVRNIYRVKERAFLVYPNGEVFARGGAFVHIDWNDPRYRNWMHGQESRVRELTEQERKEGGEVVAIDPKFEDALPGFLPPADRMFRLGRAVTKGAGATRKAAPTPPPEDKPEPDIEESADEG